MTGVSIILKYIASTYEDGTMKTVKMVGRGDGEKKEHQRGPI
jgi:hypothetical protein